MRQIILIFAAALLLASCSNKPQSTGNSEYTKKYQAALQSEIKETKCIAGLEIGQSKAQIDSVWGELYDKHLIVYFEDIDEDMVPIRFKEECLIECSSISYVHDNQCFYISVYPTMIDDGLSGLLCVIKPSAQNSPSDKPTHILFSEIFENSERGQQFEKFILPVENSDNEVIVFIKDNMAVLLYPQDGNEGTLVYQNVPDVNKQPKDNNSIEL